MTSAHRPDDQQPSTSDPAALLEAARVAQTELRSRLTHLFGREISRVDLTISGATAPQRKRVL